MRAVTTYRLWEMKQRREKIAMLTSYDYSMARIVDAAGIDVILVGDSAANVMAGYETTLPITLDMMIYHARSVVRAVSRALVVVDLPFGTYQGNSKVALDSAIRIMKETEADAVKIEGGEEILESVNRILSAGIPVMGHLGLTPQSIHKFGTYAVRAKEEAEAEKRRNGLPDNYVTELLKPIYTAANEDGALEALQAFEAGPWGAKRLWWARTASATGPRSSATRFWMPTVAPSRSSNSPPM